MVSRIFPGATGENGINGVSQLETWGPICGMQGSTEVGAKVRWEHSGKKGEKFRFRF